jgi:hypothetical protein
MSLARIAIRIAAVEALKGRTLVGSNVRDSQIAALEADADGNIQIDEEAPFIAVYTDAASTANEDIADNWLIANGETELIFEIGITAAMMETDPDTGASTIAAIGIPSTDRNFEFFLDMTARQISDALRDEDNAWAAIFRGLYYHVVRIERLRAASEAKGVRLAGQQIRLAVHVVDDPLKGDPDDEKTAPFVAFLDAMEASGNAQYVTQSGLMRTSLGL